MPRSLSNLVNNPEFIRLNVNKDMIIKHVKHDDDDELFLWYG